MGTLERTWTEVGADHNGTDEQRQTLGGYIDRLAWESVEGEKPMMPGLAIKAAMKELRLPQVDSVAISHDLAPYGLYGIQAHYSNGRARVYVVDEGSKLVVVASDFWPVQS